MLIFCILSAIVIYSPSGLSSAASIQHSSAIVHNTYAGTTSVIIHDPAHTETSKIIAEHEKRQDRIQTRRSVFVTYSCPVGGTASKTFKWVARCRLSSGTLSMHPGENINSMTHLITRANNFESGFVSKIPELVGNFCCVYLFRANIIGTVYDDFISMGLTPDRVPTQQGIKVKEFCVVVPPEFTCPLVGSTVPREFRNCHVDTAVLGHG